MNEIELALQYARRKKKIRLNQNKVYRRKARSKYSNLFTLPSSKSNEEDPIRSFTLSCSTTTIDLKNNTPTNDNRLSASHSYLDFEDIVCDQRMPPLDLHRYTHINNLDFSNDLLHFIRKANVSKKHAKYLVSLIQSALPQPNNFPKTYLDILDLLSVENLFTKRIICIACKTDLPTESKRCPNCVNDNPQHFAFVFDSIQEITFTRTYDRLSSIINSYRQIFAKQEVDNKTNDVVYNDNYKILHNSINYPFISIIIHLDGISLGKSQSKNLWVLSCSICELPPGIRNRRQNNIILSLWISERQPKINLWLDRCLCQLVSLKQKGFPSRSGDRIMVKVYGVIGDTPALNMILNHKSHVGYYCCWFCKIEGVDVNRQRQYYYAENIVQRNENDFLLDGIQAEELKTNVNGRHGRSILDKVIDIPLPRSIIVDYLHVTLLCHAKTIFRYLFKVYMVPKDRQSLDEKISLQRFPHFFNRKIRPFNSSHLKATEMRNMLLFCVLPMIRNFINVDVLGHLALFVTGIRLLHGRRVFNEKTSDIARELLTAFYRDHQKFYIKEQNFVLHIHSHFPELYKNHGSLCNINTFSQEDLMGAVSKFKNGTTNWGEQIAFYLNIDFALNNNKSDGESTHSLMSTPQIFDETCLPDEFTQVVSSFHAKICSCDDLLKCIRFYRRFKNKEKVIFHSLSYTKRQSSVSYFVKYGALFGIIVLFFCCNGKQYAIIQRHSLKSRFSDYFTSSRYHALLSSPIDNFFFVVSKVSVQVDVVDVHMPIYICIVIDNDDESFIVSPLSVYHEHD